jgi:hypothetical protein
MLGAAAVALLVEFSETTPSPMSVCTPSHAKARETAIAATPRKVYSSTFKKTEK